MPSSVYVETSVISYLTARQSQDVIVAARQAITRNWWQETKNRFEVYLSMLVIDEAGAGDAGAAAGYECPVICSPEELGGEES